MNKTFLNKHSFLTGLLNRLPHQTLFTEQLIYYSTFSSIFGAWNMLFINSCLFKVYSFIKLQLSALVKLSQVPQSGLSAASQNERSWWLRQ